MKPRAIWLLATALLLASCSPKYLLVTPESRAPSAQIEKKVAILLSEADLQKDYLVPQGLIWVLLTPKRYLLGEIVKDFSLSNFHRVYSEVAVNDTSSAGILVKLGPLSPFRMDGGKGSFTLPTIVYLADGDTLFNKEYKGLVVAQQYISFEKAAEIMLDQVFSDIIEDINWFEQPSNLSMIKNGCLAIISTPIRSKIDSENIKVILDNHKLDIDTGAQSARNGYFFHGIPVGMRKLEVHYGNKVEVYDLNFTPGWVKTIEIGVDLKLFLGTKHRIKLVPGDEYYFNWVKKNKKLKLLQSKVQGEGVNQ